MSGDDRCVDRRKYFLHKMKRGVSEPYCEKVILQALGIENLEKQA